MASENSEQAQQPVLPDEVGDGSNCLNCGTRLDGEFCHVCGQPASTERYSLKTLFQEIFIQLRKFEAVKSLRSFWALLSRPGAFLSEFLRGKRVDYIGPVRYFFYAFFIEITIKLFIRQFFPPESVLADAQAGFMIEVVDLGLTLIWGLFWWLLYRKADLNLVEYMVAAIYFVAQTSMFSALLVIIIFPLSAYYGFSDRIYSDLNLFIYFAYSCFFAWGVFRERWWVTLMKQFLVIALFYAVFVLLIRA